MTGTVLVARGAFCNVVLEDGRRLLCTVRGRMKGRPSARGAVVAGDGVEVTADGESGVVEAILPRRTLVERGEGRRRGDTQALVANVDRALVVFSARRPDCRVASMDRYLVSVEYQRMAVTLAFNKWDLADAGTEEKLSIYRGAGYDCLCLDTLADPERTRREVLALEFSSLYVCGPSGVGKSSILNAILPDGDLAAVGEVSEATGRGRQTTTAIELRALPGGRFLVDTPGTGTLVLAGMDPGNLKHFYREFAAPAASCRYGDCLHAGEPGCAVPEALGAGVHPLRHESYLGFLAHVREARRATP